ALIERALRGDQDERRGEAVHDLHRRAVNGRQVRVVAALARAVQEQHQRPGSLRPAVLRRKVAKIARQARPLAWRQLAYLHPPSARGRHWPGSSAVWATPGPLHARTGGGEG